MELSRVPMFLTVHSHSPLFLMVLEGHIGFVCGTLLEYGIEIALHNQQLLNRVLLYMWYFNGCKQTNSHSLTTIALNFLIILTFL